jgi:hypothetical protein
MNHHVVKELKEDIFCDPLKGPQAQDICPGVFLRNPSMCGCGDLRTTIQIKNIFGLGTPYYSLQKRGNWSPLSINTGGLTCARLAKQNMG